MKTILISIALILVFTVICHAEPKVRVFYEADGSVRIMGILNPQKDTRHYDMGMKKIPDLEGLEYDDIPFSQLPARDSERRYWRGAKGQGVWVDGEAKKDAQREKKIQKEKQDLLRQMAIDSLKAKGEW